jgi:hypothetical protein
MRTRTRNEIRKAADALNLLLVAASLSSYMDGAALRCSPTNEVQWGRVPAEVNYINMYTGNALIPVSPSLSSLNGNS